VPALAGDTLRAGEPAATPIEHEDSHFNGSRRFNRHAPAR
jgi:hypothetical protein